MGLYTPVGAPKWHNAPDMVKSNVLQAFEYCKVILALIANLQYYFMLFYQVFLRKKKLI